MLLLALFSILLTPVFGQTCVDSTTLYHSNSGCAAGEGTPGCAFIQANAASLCSTMLTSWEIVNGPACNLRGASYGCIYAASTHSTSDTFCCVLGSPVVATATASSSATATATATSSGSATATATASGSATATATATRTNITLTNTTNTTLSGTSGSSKQFTDGQIVGISAGSIIGFFLVSCGICCGIIRCRKNAPAETTATAAGAAGAAQPRRQSVVAINDRRPSIVTADTIQRKSSLKVLASPGPRLQVRLPETV